ncbi:ATP-dependent RNA helicase dbp4 [Loxospora ochrophaea]|nr:ATP-dependent RNA helicase dbp4 [Loxospora ochrophaea]
MAPQTADAKGLPKFRSQSRPLKRKREAEDLSTLKQRVEDLDPRHNEIRIFQDLPLSRPTASGLEESHFKSLTDIQQKALPFTLKGSDILGAAKTGSGKTLAFLVPVLENLYRRKWTEFDGLGALILSPTRELAIQIFEVLRKIGRYHTFSAGLVIGGRSLQEESQRLGRINIVVSTPGRMLQHMDQTAAFEIGNLCMLVLDEADRIMDMGFQVQVDAIIEHLPKERQTLLFSATQTKKVSDLARLSLQDPEYVSVHEAASSATPTALQQHYVVTPLPEKLDTLWSFIRANLKSKMLVFLSSGKQVRFVYETFRHLQPGVSLLHLHGRQKQTARLDVTTKFSTSKYACLFATDVVARGLDFPAVDWVIQLDCPEDADTYIHRVGRTARYERAGRAVLFLEPTEEEGMLQRLEQKKVPIAEIRVRQKKQQSIKNQLQNMCFKDPELKYLGQKAFVSYVKSVNIQADKSIFKIDQLPLEEFSASLGLPGAPRIKFQKGDNAKARKNAPRHAVSSSEDEGDDQALVNGEGKKNKEVVRSKYDRMFERTNQEILTEHYTKLIDDEGDLRNIHDNANEDEEFLTVKRRLGDVSDPGADLADINSKEQAELPNTVPALGKEPPVVDSKRREKMLKSKKKMLKYKGKGTKLVYDDDGNPHQVYELEDENQFNQRGTADDQRTRFLEEERDKVRAADILDKEAVKEKKKERKEKLKARELLESSPGEQGAKAVSIPRDEPDDRGHVRLSSNGTPEPPSKRTRKRMENHTPDEEKVDGEIKSQSPKQARNVDSLENLEAVAMDFLGRR